MHHIRRLQHSFMDTRSETSEAKGVMPGRNGMRDIGTYILTLRSSPADANIEGRA